MCYDFGVIKLLIFLNSNISAKVKGDWFFDRSERLTLDHDFGYPLPS